MNLRTNRYRQLVESRKDTLVGCCSVSSASKKVSRIVNSLVAG